MLGVEFQRQVLKPKDNFWKSSCLASSINPDDGSFKKSVEKSIVLSKGQEVRFLFALVITLS